MSKPKPFTYNTYKTMDTEMIDIIDSKATTENVTRRLNVVFTNTLKDIMPKKFFSTTYTGGPISDDSIAPWTMTAGKTF